MENRLIKLWKEQERAEKRIKDLNRRTSFVSTMNTFKNDHLGMLTEMKNSRKDKEATDRVTFNQRRHKSRENV